jgi:hypothetical protein
MSPQQVGVGPPAGRHGVDWGHRRPEYPVLPRQWALPGHYNEKTVAVQRVDLGTRRVVFRQRRDAARLRGATTRISGICSAASTASSFTSARSKETRGTGTRDADAHPTRSKRTRSLPGSVTSTRPRPATDRPEGHARFPARAALASPVKPGRGLRQARRTLASAGEPHAAGPPGRIRGGCAVPVPARPGRLEWARKRPRARPGRRRPP